MKLKMRKSFSCSLLSFFRILNVSNGQKQFAFINTSARTCKMGNTLDKKLVDMIDTKPVVVFSKTSCPFCKRAKSLLETENIDFNTYELNAMPPNDAAELGMALSEKTKSRTVPQVFICGQFIGGYTELKRLKEMEKLHSAVQKCTSK